MPRRVIFRPYTHTAILSVFAFRRGANTVSEALTAAEVTQLLNEAIDLYCIAHPYRNLSSGPVMQRVRDRGPDGTQVLRVITDG